MKITNVSIFNIKLSISNWLLIKIETDEGIVGWGDASDSFLDEGVATVLQDVAKPALIGKDPLNIKDCLAELNRWRYPVLNTVRTFAIAKSGIDQALWDITGKHYNIPLYKMYGASGVDSISVYGNLNNAIRGKRTAQNLKEQGLAAKAKGFEVVKCTPFDEVNPTKVDCDFEPGFERLKALTEVYPIEKIAIDCHQRFGRYELGVMTAKLLKDFGNPYWVEDPVPVADYATMEKMTVRYPEIRWVAGEDSFMTDEIMRTVCSDCYDVIMPDVKYIGGPSVVRGIIGAIEGMGKRVTIHNPSGPISTAHSAHLTALCAGLPLEYPVGALTEEELVDFPMNNIVNGRYVFEDKAGIGMEISEEALKKHAKEFVDSAWIKY